MNLKRFHRMDVHDDLSAGFGVLGLSFPPAQKKMPGDSARSGDRTMVGRMTPGVNSLKS